MKRFLTVLFLIIINLGTPVWQTGIELVQYVEAPNVIVDGIVSMNEYGSNFTDPATNVTVYWEHDETDFFIALENNQNGWIGIGFGPVNTGMDGADMIVGYIENNNSVINDEIGIGRMHYSDVSRGGKDNVLNSSGSIVDGIQTLEFIIPLNSGDSLDQTFVVNRTYGFFFAYQTSSKDITVIHSGFSQSYRLILEPSPRNIPTGQPNYTSFLIVIGVFIAIMIVVIVIRVTRRPKVYRFSEMEKL